MIFSVPPTPPNISVSPSISSTCPGYSAKGVSRLLPTTTISTAGNSAAEAAGGGTLLSSGIYALQLMAWLFGGIREIRGTAGKLESGVEWQYILTGETNSGVLFSAKNSTRATLDNTCRMFGEYGWIELPDYC